MTERDDGGSARREGTASAAADRGLLQEHGYAMDRLDAISRQLERAKLAEYVGLLNRPISLIWRNLLGGISRGVGIAIGFTVFAATIMYVLRMLGALNLPIVGDYIADIVRIVQHQLELKAY